MTDPNSSGPGVADHPLPGSKKEETYFWLETIIKPIVDHNEVIKLVCTSRNITGQRIAQEKLKKKDQLLYAVSQATHLLLSNTDLNQAIASGIEILGTKTLVDRVYVFKNIMDEETGNGSHALFMNGMPTD